MNEQERINDKLSRIVELLLRETREGRIGWLPGRDGKNSLCCLFTASPIGDYILRLTANDYPYPHRVFLDIKHRDFYAGEMDIIREEISFDPLTVLMFLEARRVAYRVDEAIDKIIEALEKTT